MGKISVYASNGAAVDTNDQAAAARAGQARSLMANFGAAVAFFDPGADGASASTGWTRWIAETPELAFFAHYVDRLQRRQAHVRSGEVEQVLALASDPFAGAFTIYAHAQQRRHDLPARGRLRRHGAGGGPGQHRRPDHPRRPRGAPHAPGRATPTATWPSRTPTPPTLTTAIKRDVFNMRGARLRVVAARLAGAELHPGRGLPQPDRDLPAPPARPGTATGGCASGSWATTRSTSTTSRRR